MGKKVRQRKRCPYPDCLICRPKQKRKVAVRKVLGNGRVKSVLAIHRELARLEKLAALNEYEAQAELVNAADALRWVLGQPVVPVSKQYGWNNIKRRKR
jgi:hypothetical protein